VRPYPHPRAPEALVERARAWGTQVGLLAAEPFVLLREIVR
jgi:N-acetylglucosamine malate deacetylase 1